MSRGDLQERFWAKVAVRGEDECWEWQAATLPRGHGTLGRGGGTANGNVLAHRLSYELHHGDIEAGRVIHHQCENPGCVNPRHLVSLTQAEHLRIHRESLQLKASCPQGHPYNGENLYVNPKGQRFCRICQREAKRRYKARKRAERPIGALR